MTMADLQSANSPNLLQYVDSISPYHMVTVDTAYLQQDTVIFDFGLMGGDSLEATSTFLLPGDFNTLDFYAFCVCIVVHLQLECYS